MCQEEHSAIHNVLLFGTEILEHAEECDIWLCWTEDDCYTTSALMLAVWDPTCVCVCVITTHLFHIEALLHQRIFILFAPTIYQQDYLKKNTFVWWGLFGNFTVRASWSWPCAGESSQEATLWHKPVGGGLEFGNPTLHSLARNLISHKGNVAHLSKNILRIYFQKCDCHK